MNMIGFVAVVFFAIGWAAGFVMWFYTAYHLVMGWFRLYGQEGAPSHRRRALRGAAAFCGCAAFVVFNGLIGAWLGGWQITVGQ